SGRHRCHADSGGGQPGQRLRRRQRSRVPAPVPVPGATALTPMRTTRDGRAAAARGPCRAAAWAVLLVLVAGCTSAPVTAPAPEPRVAARQPQLLSLTERRT